MKMCAILFPLLALGLFAGCDGSADGNGNGIVTIGTASVSPAGDELGIREPLVITFTDPVDTASLALSGSLPEYATGAWSEDSTIYTLSPTDGAWESGTYTLAVNAKDANGSPLAIEKRILLNFTTFQAADVVIGQEDFSKRLANGGLSAPPAANRVSNPRGGVTVVDGRLYLPDPANRRVLGFNAIPAMNNVAADFVIGQPDFTTNTAGTAVDKFWSPYAAASNGDALWIADAFNNRVLAFDPVPQGGPADATGVLGQVDFTTRTATCGAGGLSTYPVSVFATGEHIIVADRYHHRVLIWNTPNPTNGASADVVVGAPDFTSCSGDPNDEGGSPSAEWLYFPGAVWSDGKRLAVADEYARVLIWNTLPASNFQPADVIVGQSDFAHNQYNDDDQDGGEGPVSARTMSVSYGIASNGVQLFVADMYNNRLLVWNSFPTTNFQPADVVLGQDDFVSKAANDPDQNGASNASASARTFYGPQGMSIYRDKLFVADGGNHRFLIFSSN